MQFFHVSVRWGLQRGWHLHDRILTKLKTCVYMSNGLAFAAGGLLLWLVVYVRTADRPPSTDIGSSERDTTAMCESSITVNISLAVSCPPCQHLHLTEARGLWLVEWSPGRNVPFTRKTNLFSFNYAHQSETIISIRRWCVYPHQGCWNEAPPWFHSSPEQNQGSCRGTVDGMTPQVGQFGKKSRWDAAVGLEKWISATDEGKYDVAAAECLLSVLPNLIWKHLGEPACSRNQ